MRNFWLKEEAIRHAVFPQLPSFCAVAVCCGALNALLGTSLTQVQMHELYGVGEWTKLHLPPGQLPPDLKSLPRSGRGMSNWDVIRLFNAAMLDAGREPHAAVLCGRDFVRETADEPNLRRLFEWARQPSNQVVVHLMNHYALIAGLLRPEPGKGPYLVLADSSITKGPLRSLLLAEVRGLAAGDERYGWILFSDRLIPEDLFSLWTESMRPSEVRRRERFERRGTSG